jgi:hypothetical protein
MGTVDGDPGVLDAPDDQYGHVDRRVQRLDLIGVALIGLRDLAVERGLAGAGEPRRAEHVQLVGRERVVSGAGDVRAHQRRVQRRREPRERRSVFRHEAEELRAPGR